jgi:threonyl-tRNA synthetase
VEQDDHRILARRLDLFHIEEDAPGMVYWHPAGWRLYCQLQDFIRTRMRQFDYEEVQSPQLLPRSLWERSGHWEKFGENMFVVPRENGRDLALKPMSCPCHLQIYNSALRSWRDLPVRLFEFGACHRDEPSGSMHGLMRTRSFVQDDAHVICMPGQVEAEVARFVALLSSVYTDLGFDNFGVALSLRPQKRAGSDADWDRAEAQLLAAAEGTGLAPISQPGEGAFYGPKLEFSLRDRQGRSWQCGTIQLDLVLPSRLDAVYVDANGNRAVPVMLHHAVFGSMGRFIGILLEHYRGKLPFWLAPTQIAVIPLAEEQHEDARNFQRRIGGAGLRSQLFDQAETLSRRIVSSHDLLIPVVAILGKREAQDGSVTLKSKHGQWVLKQEEALARLAKAVAEYEKEFSASGAQIESSGIPVRVGA